MSSLFGISANPKIELKTSPNITAQLGQNVTLTCEANLDSLSIKQLSWVSPSKNQWICKYENGNIVPENSCEVINGTSLVLKLINVSPADQGVYICKLRSMDGESNNRSTVTVQGELTFNRW